MKVIGLTGGIASGKSTASAYLRSLGAQIVDADAISRASTRKGEAGYAAVVARFGREILRPDGEIDRRKLGALVFADEGQRSISRAHGDVLQVGLRRGAVSYTHLTLPTKA